MSVNYASGLSDYDNKGKLDLKELFDLPEVFEKKVHTLTAMIKEANHLVVHTGAGISTSSGIPDFRGPKGVWTLEMKGEKPEFSTSFAEAKPSKTHMALVMLEKQGIVKYIVSQNVDGLHLISGFPREKLSELHGNMFLEKCEKCQQSYVRDSPVATMALKRTGNVCSRKSKRGTICRGKLRDTVLDWEDNLPYDDIIKAEQHSKKADLSLCLGTSMQINPSGNLPILTVKNKGNLAICNLSQTKHDKKASIVIHGYVDDIMERVVSALGLSIPEYDPQVFMSSVTLFSKRKCEEHEENVIDSKYGRIKDDAGVASDKKRIKLEK
eukprot:gene10206-11255_t